MDKHKLNVIKAYAKLHPNTGATVYDKNCVLVGFCYPSGTFMSFAPASPRNYRLNLYLNRKNKLSKIERFRFLRDIRIHG